MPRLRILYAVSSMGLGHVQRSLPLLRALLGRGDEVVVVSHGRALEALRIELAEPEGRPGSVRFLAFPDYPPLQRGRGVAHYLRFLPDVIGMERVMAREGRLLARLHRETPFDLVVGDGRFGFRTPGVPSILLSHQLRFFLPPLLRPFQGLSDAWQRKLLRSFHQVVVHDLPDPGASLAGLLAHNAVADAVAPRYIGPLSTLGEQGVMEEEGARPEEGGPGEGGRVHGKAGDAVETTGPEVVFVMGGFIEAERRRFVEAVRRVHEGAFGGAPPRMAFLLGGGQWEEAALPTGVEVHRLLVGAARRRLLVGARLWVGRSGQTTLMDLWATRSCGVLVPTPGMTEHLRLAEMVRGWNHAPEPGRDAELARPFLAALPESVYFDGRRLPPTLLSWRVRDSVEGFLRIVDAEARPC